MKILGWIVLSAHGLFVGIGLACFSVAFCKDEFIKATLALFFASWNMAKAAQILSRGGTR